MSRILTSIAVPDYVHDELRKKLDSLARKGIKVSMNGFIVDAIKEKLKTVS